MKIDEMRIMVTGAASGMGRHFALSLCAGGARVAAVDVNEEGLGQLTAADAMTPGGVSVSPDASIEEVAKTLRQRRIHRVLVLDGEAVVGIISTFDLVKLLETPPAGGSGA